MQILLLSSAGVGLYVGLFHLALRRQHSANPWLAGWGFASAVFVIARTLQLEASDPHAAAIAARVATAMTPIFLWTLLRFVGELTELQASRAALRAFAICNIGLALASLGTGWFVTGAVTPRLGLFGRPYHGSVAGPGMLLLIAYLCGALVWVWGQLARTKALDPGERRTLGVALTLYAGLGLSSVLASLEWTPWPGLAEFGPLVMSIGASHLVANREQRLRHDLESLVQQRTAALYATEERYRSLVENAPIGVLVCDHEGRVLTTTRRFRDILGLDPADLAPGTNLFARTARSGPWRVGLVRKALEAGESMGTEGPLRTARGEQIELKATVVLRRDSGGAVSGAVIVIEDVTERRALESRLRQSHKMEAIGQLAAGIAHGIATPIDSLRTGLAGMRSDWARARDCVSPVVRTDDGRSRLGEIEQLLDESCEGAERAVAIVRDMAEFAQGGSLAVEPVDLNALVSGAVRMASTQRRGSAQIEERLGELPPVVANAGQLRQVFLNLLVNALQAIGDRGTVVVETARDADGVRVRVSDDGPGIAPEHRERLFVPFFTTKPAGEGTGLGLFISYQVVQRHGGEIRVTSSPGKGATFEVRLPVDGDRSLGAAA